MIEQDKTDIPALFDAELKRMSDLFRRKNKNYGNSFFETPALLPNGSPVTGGLYRMGDKIARLRSLAAGVKDEVGESFVDTLRDLAAYAVMTVIACGMEDAQKDAKEK